MQNPITVIGIYTRPNDIEYCVIQRTDDPLSYTVLSHGWIDCEPATRHRHIFYEIHTLIAKHTPVSVMMYPVKNGDQPLQTVATIEAGAIITLATNLYGKHAGYLQAHEVDPVPDICTLHSHAENVAVQSILKILNILDPTDTETQTEADTLKDTNLPPV